MKAPFLIGRLLFGGYFLYSGINHFTQRRMLAQYVSSKRVPKSDLAVIASGAVPVSKTRRRHPKWSQSDTYVSQRCLLPAAPGQRPGRRIVPGAFVPLAHESRTVPGSRLALIPLLGRRCAPNCRFLARPLQRIGYNLRTSAGCAGCAVTLAWGREACPGITPQSGLRLSRKSLPKRPRRTP